MRWGRGLAVTLLAALGSGMAPDAPTLASRVVGTWRIVSHEERKSEGDAWQNHYGVDPRGFLMYDTTGHMSVQIAKAPRPKFTGPDGEPTADEAREAVNGYVAYFGRYSVDEKTGVVTHHVESGLWPDYVGTDQIRPAKLEGDRLILSDGKTWRVVWQRVE